MEDIAAAGPGAGDGDWPNLSPGNPSHIPEIVSAWRRLTREAPDERFVEAGAHYGPSRSSSGLVEALVDYFNLTYGWSIGPRNVVVGPGSQMLSSVATSLFTGPGPDGRMRPAIVPGSGRTCPDHP
ncbi:hypothetical protein NX801_19915 [Streptomyces sp. LP05-1]|uniref:Uncharacterized protein n=1 Tax=Streptomyces pyxinae TaxID=2970734 RepID=A0ABT2CKE3_9ACTN|nr:hypothetical protein [Streptomyces sp. LP05-1]MCS0637884.1 hypothetical protein [Streptomyces sp. LP05-1]